MIGTATAVCVVNETATVPGLPMRRPGVRTCKFTCVTAAPGGMEYGEALVTKPFQVSMVIMCHRLL